MVGVAHHPPPTLKASLPACLTAAAAVQCSQTSLAPSARLAGPDTARQRRGRTKGSLKEPSSPHPHPALPCRVCTPHPTPGTPACVPHTTQADTSGSSPAGLCIKITRVGLTSPLTPSSSPVPVPLPGPSPACPQLPALSVRLSTLPPPVLTPTDILGYKQERAGQLGLTGGGGRLGAEPDSCLSLSLPHTRMEQVTAVLLNTATLTPPRPRPAPPRPGPATPCCGRHGALLACPVAGRPGARPQGAKPRQRSSLFLLSCLYRCHPSLLLLTCSLT